MLPEELTAALASRIVFQSCYPKVNMNKQTNLTANCGFWGMTMRKRCFYLLLLTFYLVSSERESSSVFHVLWEKNYNLSGTWLRAFPLGVYRWYIKTKFMAKKTGIYLNSGNDVLNLWCFFDSCLYFFIYLFHRYLSTHYVLDNCWILGIQSWVKGLGVIEIIIWQGGKMRDGCYKCSFGKGHFFCIYLSLLVLFFS